MPVIEVGARSWLYPRRAVTDSHIKESLGALGRLKSCNKPSLKASFMTQFVSKCVSYEKDLPLICLLHDKTLNLDHCGQHRSPEDGARGIGINPTELRQCLAEGAGEAGRHVPSGGEVVEFLFHNRPG